MARWNSLFVSEMNHTISRFNQSGDVEALTEKLNIGMTSEDEFCRAYTFGVIDWLKNKGVVLDIALREVVVLSPPALPPLYLEPAFVGKIGSYTERAIPEFKTYGVIIDTVGDSA